MVERGIPRDKILPITYINSDATVKAKVGRWGVSSVPHQMPIR